MSSTFSAEYGRAAGGVVNSVIRSGTNQLHGSLHYFHRNRVLDARNFFDPGDTPAFRRHQYGATGGGPIVEDKVFIFAAWEGVRQFRGETSSGNVPTASAKSGVFQDGTVIPIDPVYLPFLSKYPDPNVAIAGNTDVGRFASAPGFKVSADFFTVRSDIQFNDINSFNASYLIEDGAIDQRDGLDNASLSSFSRRQLIATTLTSVLTPNLINSVRVGYSRPFGQTGALISDFEEFNVASPEFSFVPGRPPPASSTSAA